jgi:hypothetical protein
MPSRDQIKSLLRDLCVTYGFCLSSKEKEKLINDPPNTVDEFTDAVYRAEGMNPSDSTPRGQRLREKVRTCVAKTFEINPKTMRRKSPQLKKQDEYDKDHRTFMENPHAFRKNWSKKKARINRKERHLLQLLVAKGDEISNAQMRSLIRPKSIYKTGVKTLREAVAIRTRRRGNGPPKH